MSLPSVPYVYPTTLMMSGLRCVGMSCPGSMYSGMVCVDVIVPGLSSCRPSCSGWEWVGDGGKQFPQCRCCGCYSPSLV